jgi:hypothetical protein
MGSLASDSRPAHAERAPRLLVLGVAVAGVAVDVLLPATRDWLYHHAFTNGILVGVVLISATYLVVERALERREHQRWSEATQPLLATIAALAATTDHDVRTHAPSAAAGAEWLAELLQRYEPILTGTPELIRHLHAALSFVQHARSTLARPGPDPGAPYEAAWSRLRAAFADVHDFRSPPTRAGETWIGRAVTDPHPAQHPRNGRP